MSLNRMSDQVGPLNVNLSATSAEPAQLELLAFLLRVYPELSSTAKPLIPFIVIQHIFLNNETQFLKQLTTTVGSNDLSDLALTSSCCNNAFAVSTLFFGESLAKRVLNRFRQVMSIGIEINLPSGQVWECCIFNLFDGSILVEMDRDFKINEAKVDHDCCSEEEILKKKANVYGASANIAFLKFFTPRVKELTTTMKEDNEIIEKLKEHVLTYNFNASVLSVIKNEIENNIVNTNLNASHIYFVYVVDLDSETNMISVDHAFLLEQFYVEKNQEVRYRIYQSWIYQATLAEDFKKRGYDKTGAGAWNYNEMKSFMGNLERFYCKNSTNGPVSSMECFGYSSDATKPLLIFEDNKLRGVSVRYFSDRVDPSQPLTHLVNLLNSNPDLANEINSCNVSTPSYGKAFAG